MRQESGLLSRYWYVAARSRDLGSRHPLPVTILGEDMVLWREGSGRTVAAIDRCLHRNAPLSEGEVFDGSLGCPYHGWTYDGQGRCVGVPAEGPEGTRYDGAQLEVFPVVEREGLIWTWMGRGGPPDREPPSRPHMEERGWRHHTAVAEIRAGVTELAENFMDVPHTMFVHRGLFRSRAKRRIPAVVERRAEEVRVTYHQPEDAVGLGGRLLNPRRRPVIHTDRFFLPGTVRVDYAFGEGGGAITVTNACTPIDEGRTRVTVMIAYRLGLRGSALRLVVPRIARTILGQDARVVEAQGRVLRRRNGPEYHSTPADIMHVHIRELREWARQDEPGGGLPPVTTHVDLWV